MAITIDPLVEWMGMAFYKSERLYALEKERDEFIISGNNCIHSYTATVQL